MEEAVIFRATPEIASHLRDATRGARSDVGLTMRVVDEATGEYRVVCTVGETEYPYKAFLVDLPCIIEMHKTADHQEYAKSGNVSKALVLASPDAEREDVLTMARTPNGLDTLDSGITPPTAHIVQRRFAPADRIATTGTEAMGVSNMESMVLRLMQSTSQASKTLTYSDVIPVEDFMGDWPESVTIEYKNGIPVKSSPLIRGGMALDATGWDAAAAAAAASTRVPTADEALQQQAALLQG